MSYISGSSAVSLDGTVITGGTAGSIIFFDASSTLAQDNANLFWDDALNILQVSALTVSGATNLNGTNTLANLTVTGASTLASLSVTGASSLSTLDVSGASTFASISVSGTSALTAVTASNLTMSGLVTLSALTAGSVLFVGSSKQIAQDNTNFFWDDTNNRLGVGTNAPQVPLHVVGSSTSHRGFGNAVQVWEGSSATIIFETSTTGTGWAMTNIGGSWALFTNPFGTFLSRIGVASTGQVSITPSANITPTTPEWLHTGAAHTAVTASTELIDVNFNLARTVQHATGALATQRAFVIQAPTYSFVGASTLSFAATFAITGAPAAGTNATITNKVAAWIQGGITTSTSPGDGNEAFGFAAGLGSSGSTSVGATASASSGGTSLGFAALATASFCIGVGRSTSATHAGSIVIGSGSSSTAVDQLILGGGADPIADCYLGGGVTIASPNAVTIQPTGGSGSDNAGANFTIAGGKGTGAGLPGQITFQTSTVAGSSSTLQSLATRAEITQLDGLKMSSRFQRKQGTDAASATNLTLSNDGSVFELTGTTKVDLINNTNWQDGATITLIANESVVIDHGTTTSGANVQIRLAGAVDYSMTAGDTLTLCLSSTTAEGQAWREISRAVI